ncbi:GNAT family N-acetyltransferase [Salinarimonas sp.]|uniref:GNAT family N-acetyltransferase n=1 Tax=Salinarimonas sp. TaxID=2766526 RepID=UPI003919B345
MTTIRPVEARDLPAVREALVASWHATYDALLGPDKVRALTDAWHSPQALAAQIGLPDAAFLLAEDDGRVVGSAFAHVDRAGASCLRRLYLLPEAQGNGLGGRLLDAVLAPLGERPAWLEVEARNRPAIGFYAARGFAAHETRGECGGSDAASALVMRRPHGLRLRRAEDRDAQDLFGLVTLCFSEYPGCYTDPHGDMPELVRPGTSAAARDMIFLVVEDETGRVAACVAVDFPAQATAELHRLYVRPDSRRRGLARHLVGLAEGHARARAARRMILWSDTRFNDAHRLYERLGYLRGPETRDLGDISGSREFFFERAL